jgi:hypothetical protein
MEGNKWIHRLEIKKRWKINDVDLNRLIFKGLPVYKANYEEWSYKNPFPSLLTVVQDPNSVQFSTASYFDLNDIINYENIKGINILQTDRTVTELSSELTAREYVSARRMEDECDPIIAVEMRQKKCTHFLIGLVLAKADDYTSVAPCKTRSQRLIKKGEKILKERNGTTHSIKETT